MLSWPKKQNKIAQILPTVSDYDAITNHVMLMNEILEENGFDTMIYAQNFDPDKYEGIVSDFKNLKDRHFDIGIYHHAIGSTIIEKLKKFKTPIGIYYHNITPAEYYQMYNLDIYKNLKNGRKNLKELKNSISFSFAASKFSAKELEDYNYKNIEILPVFFNPDKFDEIKESQKVEEFMDNKNIDNILFVGRFAPNKAHKDLIKAFYIYNKYYNSISRLTLVGGLAGVESYFTEIQDLIKILGIEKVVHIPGKVNNNEWKTYYKNSDLFLSASEHEGFFVPVLEANYFELPILAYEAGAIPSTVGDAGILYKDKDPRLIAELIYRILNNKDLKNKLISLGRKNWKKYTQEKYEKKLIKIINKFISA